MLLGMRELQPQIDKANWYRYQTTVNKVAKTAGSMQETQEEKL
jgi:hypothetical protein